MAMGRSGGQRGIFLVGSIGLFLACASDDQAVESGQDPPDVGSSGGSSEPDPVGAPDAESDDPETLLTDAFVWGYPAVVTQRTLQLLGGLVGVNTLFNQTAISNSLIRVIVAPNQDTLYSISIVDLRSEPVVLSVPEVTDRYWTYQLLDAWTESFHYLGTRATGGSAGTYVITPPEWSGDLPAGTERIPSPTPQLFILGRFHVRGPTDVDNVTTLDRTLVGLHQYTGAAPPPPLPPLGEALGAPAETGMNGARFFDELGDALAKNGPASDHDKSQLERFASVGIGPGLHPTEGADADTMAMLEEAVAAGQQRLLDEIELRQLVDGWTQSVAIGRYGDDYLMRALVARIGWGANIPEEAVYPISRVDPDGNPYVGSNRYVMHFEADRIPPVDALEPLIDVDRFLTYFAMEALTASWDSYSTLGNNFWLYNDPDTGFELIPWGTDATLSEMGLTGGPRLQSVSIEATLSSRLYALPEIRDRYVQRLRDLLDEVWDEDAIVAQIDAWEELVGDANPVEVEQIRQFVLRRREVIEAEIADGAPEGESYGGVCFEPGPTVSGTFSGVWLDDPSAAGDFASTASLVVDGAPLTLSDVSVFATIDANPILAGAPGVAVSGVSEGGAPVTVSVAIENLLYGVGEIPLHAISNVGFVLAPTVLPQTPFGFVSEGSITLDQAGRSQGEPVSGRFDGRIFSFGTPEL